MLAVATGLNAFTAEDAADRAKVETLAAAALKREAEGDWKKIQWEKNSEDALKKSADAKKPLLIVLVVGERGQKNAAEC